ncbi:MAG: thioredoxin fold domain-containing protein [Bacteroidota bacterium]
MKNILLFLSFLLTLNLYGKGIKFFQGTWEEALVQAAAEEKIIFVDAYAEWCGPCKRMARNVFTDSEVGDYYNANFLNLKVDMEKPANATFAKAYPVKAFPTLYFIDSKGEVVHKVKGAQSVEQFINMGKNIVSKTDRSVFYEEAYAKGDRSPELMYKYVQALNKADRPSLKIANDYINSQRDLTTADNLKFILEAASEMDSRIFDLLIQHRAAIEKISSTEEVNQRIAQAAKKTLKKAVEFESEDLLVETQQKIKQHLPDQYLPFYLESEMKFAQSTRDANRYLKAWKKYVTKVASSEVKEQSLLASALARSFPDFPAGLKAAEKVAAKAATDSQDVDAKIIYADLLLLNGKREEAKKIATQAMQLAKQSGNQMKVVKAMRLLKQLN